MNNTLLLKLRLQTKNRNSLNFKDKHIKAINRTFTSSTRLCAQQLLIALGTVCITVYQSFLLQKEDKVSYVNQKFPIKT